MHIVHHSKLNENNIKNFNCIGYNFVDNKRTFKLNWTIWPKKLFSIFLIFKKLFLEHYQHINNTGQNPLKYGSDSTALMKDPFLY